MCIRDRVTAKSEIDINIKIEGEDLSTKQHIPVGHKIATQNINQGDDVIKYDNINILSFKYMIILLVGVVNMQNAFRLGSDGCCCLVYSKFRSDTKVDKIGQEYYSESNC